MISVTSYVGFGGTNGNYADMYYSNSVGAPNAGGGWIFRDREPHQIFGNQWAPTSPVTAIVPVAQSTVPSLIARLYWGGSTFSGPYPDHSYISFIASVAMYPQV